MHRAAMIFAFVGGAAFMSTGCAEEPDPVLAGRSVAVTTPDGLVTRHDRCAYAVAKVAAAHLGCTVDEIELQPVGPAAFLAKGCDRLGTYLCDDEPRGVRVSER